MVVMIGYGIDTVEVSRFAPWHTYSYQRLRRIFSEEEIAYCLSVPSKTAERFAVRFAAREALFKALHMAGHTHVPFLRLCSCVCVRKGAHGEPVLVVDWQRLLGEQDAKLTTLTSLTHTHTVATALVYIMRL